MVRVTDSATSIPKPAGANRRSNSDLLVIELNLAGSVQACAVPLEVMLWLSLRNRRPRLTILKSGEVERLSLRANCHYFLT
jgi:hypothetical protein